MWLTNVYHPHLIKAFFEDWGIAEWHDNDDRSSIRGTIYDRNYKELAVSYERVSVYANIREIDNLKDVVEPLASILGEPERVLYERLSGNTLRLWLAKDISQEQEEKIRSLELSGVFFNKEHVRYHPQAESAAHLIGFVENESGLAGVEYLLDQLQIRYRLTGEKLNKLAKIAEGRPGAEGQHLILTIDLKIQNTLERFLKKQIEYLDGRRAGVLVMEARTGALIGYSQMPSFDPNKFHTFPKNIFRDLFNTSIAVPETFKVFLRDLSLLKSQPEESQTVLPWPLVAEKRKLGVQLQLWDALGAGAQEDYDFVNAQATSMKNDNYSAVQSERDFETVPGMLTPLQITTAVVRSVNGGFYVVPRAGDRYFLRNNQNEYLLEDLRGHLNENRGWETITGEARLLFKALGRENQLDSATLYGESSSYNQQQGDSLFHHDLSLTLVPAGDPELILLTVVEEPGYRTRKRNEAGQLFEMDKLIAPVSALQQVMKNLADMMEPKEREERNFQNKQAGEGQLSEHKGYGVDQQLVITRMVDLRGMSLRKSLRILQETGVEVHVEGSGRVVEHEPVAGSVLVGGAMVVLRLERDSVDSDKIKQQDDE